MNDRTDPQSGTIGRLRPAGKPLRVLHVLGDVRASGMERMLLSASTSFSELGVDGHVLAQAGPSDFLPTLERAGYRAHRIDADLSWAERVRQLRTLVDRERIGVIHLHTESDYFRTVLALRAAGRFRIPIVRTIHNVFASRGRWRLSRWLQSLIADRFVSALTAPSSDVAENEQRIGRRCQVVYNWVDWDFLTPPPLEPTPTHQPGSPLAIVVGNCSPVKRHELALAAVRSIGHDLVHLGSEEKIVAAEVDILAEMAANRRLTFRGVASPKQWLDQATYYVMPSTNEGMSVALAEAVCNGLPCVVSDVPGNQWARGIAGVFHVQEGADWMAPLREAARTGRIAVDERTAIDFSPIRGAREYFDIYLRAAGRQLRGERQ